MNLKTIVDNIYYIGVNDRQKESFENYIPLPHGVSYNSYVIVDENIVSFLPMSIVLALNIDTNFLSLLIQFYAKHF